MSGDVSPRTPPAAPQGNDTTNNVDILAHVFNTLLGISDPVAPILLALQAYWGEDTTLNITDIIGMRTDDYMELSYKKDGRAKLYPAKGHMMLLCCLRGFYEWRKTTGHPIRDPIDWTTVTKEEFNDFRLGDDWTRIRANPVPPDPSLHVTTTPGGSVPSPMATSRSSTTGNSTRSALSDFQRGIKRDPALFTTFKDDSRWEAYHRTLLSQARAQGVENVLDKSYKPTTPEEIALFDAQQKYMYSVFERTLLTSNGLRAVRAHIADYDAQAVYATLLKTYEDSIRADEKIAELLRYITTAKLGPDSTWNGTTEDFVLHWLEQVRLYTQLVPEADMHLHESMQRTLLENAVSKHPELASVKNTARIMGLESGKTLTFEQYIALLQAKATESDRSNRAPGTRRATRRTVNEHSTTVPFDINTSIADIDAISSTSVDDSGPTTLDVFRAQRVSLPKDIWHSLSLDEQRTWDTFSDDTKRKLLHAYANGEMFAGGRNDGLRPDNPEQN